MKITAKANEMEKWTKENKQTKKEKRKMAQMSYIKSQLKINSNQTCTVPNQWTA